MERIIQVLIFVGVFLGLDTIFSEDYGDSFLIIYGFTSAYVMLWILEWRHDNRN